MDNILIATDLAPENENVLHRAIQLAQFSKARLHILHVFSALRMPTANPREVTTELNRRKEYLYGVIDQHKKNNPVKFSLHIVDGGRVYDRVREYTLDAHAELVVIGKSDRSKDGTNLVSTTTERICAKSRVPVLVVSSQSTEPYRNTLVYADLADISKTGVALVTRFAPNVYVTFLQGSGTYSVGRGFMSQLKYKYSKWKSRNFLKRMKALLIGNGIAANSLVCKEVETMDADTLMKEVRQGNVDLLVIRGHDSQKASHKPDVLTRALLEATSSDLLTVGRR